MKRLLLINPVGRRSGFLLSSFTTLQPLSLAYLAAVTPTDWDVRIADEIFGEVRLEKVDLVGITAFTSTINRAYEIATLFRSAGTKVVLGGIHVSMLPDEALRFADAVVVGEAEGIWGKVIDDFEHDRMAGIYVGPRMDLAAFSIKPRRNLLDPEYFFQSIQTSRGCPFNCDFCSVSRYLGTTYRQRSVEEVLAELDEITGRYLFFLDDNLVGYSTQSKDRAKLIFEGMIRKNLRKRWWMQSSINAADDEELLRLASRAGCMFAFVGFESISEENLRDMKKGVNIRIGVDNYKRVIRTFHRNGIGVSGAFISGNDHESPQYYRQLARFLVAAGVDTVQLSILTPLPGTALFERVKREGRLLFENFPEDWKRYRLSHVVHKPIGVDPETIYFGNNYIKKHIYSFPRNQYRILKSLVGIRRLVSFYAVVRMNKAYKRGWKHSHYYNKNVAPSKT
ncbi:MAG TPA: radical SAM protein [Spirochaetia bacterium]|nr:radical SAM protein [Spirochaetia bacterium]